MYRKATMQDCESIYALLCDMEQTQLPFQRFSTIYARQLENQSYYALVRVEGEKVLGIINLRFEEQLHHAGRIAEILEFAVDPGLPGAKAWGRNFLPRPAGWPRRPAASKLRWPVTSSGPKPTGFMSGRGCTTSTSSSPNPLTGEDPGENALGR